jgi:glycerol dehydrogenase
MSTVILGPARYIRSKGALEQIGEESKPLGAKALIIGGQTALQISRLRIEASLGQQRIDTEFIIHSGECAREKIAEYQRHAKAAGADLIVGVGGGKAIDSAKTVAHQLRLPLVTVPTIAATCAGWSALAVFYTKEGKPDGQLSTWKSPDVCLVDLEIMATAPQRYLAAGMGDSIAKLHETRFNTRGLDLSATAEATILISQLIYNLVEVTGQKAMAAVSRQEISRDLELIVDSNILLTGIASGLAGDEVRLSAAHAFHNAILTLYDQAEETLHGEKVAFGTIVQMILENKDEANLREVVGLVHSLQLPVTLDDLHLPDSSPATVQKLAEATLTDSLMRTAPFKVSLAEMESAIDKAHQLGIEVKRK